MQSPVAAQRFPSSSTRCRTAPRILMPAARQLWAAWARPSCSPPPPLLKLPLSLEPLPFRLYPSRTSLFLCLPPITRALHSPQHPPPCTAIQSHPRSLAPSKLNAVDADFAKYSESARQHKFNGVVLASATDDDLSELLRCPPPPPARSFRRLQRHPAPPSPLLAEICGCLYPTEFRSKLRFKRGRATPQK
jgi:hypothetical protein